MLICRPKTVVMWCVVCSVGDDGDSHELSAPLLQLPAAGQVHLPPAWVVPDETGQAGGGPGAAGVPSVGAAAPLLPH